MSKILGYDPSDQEYFVSFMVEAKNSFKWPDKPDTVWITADAILMAIDEPIGIGKIRNMFKFRQE